MLRDLASILHPDAFPGADAVWFRRIAGEEVDAHRVVSADDCDAPWLCREPSVDEREFLFSCNGVACGGFK